MSFLPILAALGASTGWATGIVMAQRPAQCLGAFDFTRIQLTACACLLAVICSAAGFWTSVPWAFWPAYLVSSAVGVVLGNLAMIECLRRAGPQRSELLLTLKGPFVAIAAYLALGEALTAPALIGGALVLAGVVAAILFGRQEHSGEQSGDKGGAAKGMAGGAVAALALGAAAALCQGLGFLLLKPALQHGAEPLALAAIRLIGAAAIIHILSFCSVELSRRRAPLTVALLAQTIAPGVLGYVVSSSLLLYAIAAMEAGVAVVLGSLSPILVLPILWVRDGRAPSWRAVIAAALAVLGTAIIAMER